MSARAAKVIERPRVAEVNWSYGPELTTDMKELMHGLVTDYADHFSFGMHDLGRHSTHQIRLDLNDDGPVF